MPKMSNIDLFQLRGQPTLAIRQTAKVETLPMLIGETYGKLAAYLQELGELLSDVPFVMYHNMDMQNLDVEIGFPVARTLPGRGNIQAGSIPACKAAVCLHRGAYSEMGPMYEEMMQWIPAQGFEATGATIEYYYNDPSVGESELLTKVVMLLK